MPRRRSYSRDDLSNNLVGCVIGDVRYAIPIAIVKQITNPLATFSPPGASGLSKGLANFRDELITVVSMRAHFGLQAEFATHRTKWVIVDISGRRFALEVDWVTEVFRSSSPQHWDGFGGTAPAQGVIGVTDNRGVLLLLLDVPAILGSFFPGSSDLLALAENKNGA